MRGDGILLLRHGVLSRVFQRREILFRLGMTMRNSIPLRRCEISVLRRCGLFKFDAACDAPECPFKS
ncbi:hypothetical protein CAMGR0001_1618 [Campylobacter gracilis RM3268]|uniref:Uncharacterized protein n=1 Tax=Campylobacter gracilis RM3268 TaxID=553220 RepID=C8PIF7_9BACT|nr:hypothetical protein CAMGR0001_1618 [Campylobacter gracilis RM3268]